MGTTIEALTEALAALSVAACDDRWRIATADAPAVLMLVQDARARLEAIETAAKVAAARGTR